MPENLLFDIPDIKTLEKPRRPVFQLPPEHGALVSFSLSCALALKVGNTASQAMDMAVITFILMTGSLHRPWQMAILGFTGALILAFNFNQPLMALCLLGMPLGYRITSECQRLFGASIRQTVGMLGISALPLSAALIAAHGSPLSLLALIGFTAASMLSTGIVLLYQNKANIRTEPALLTATALWLWLLFFHLQTALLGFFPFLFQCLWIAWANKPTFKQIGIAEALCLTWTTLILFWQTL